MNLKGLRPQQRPLTEWSLASPALRILVTTFLASQKALVTGVLSEAQGTSLSVWGCPRVPAEGGAEMLAFSFCLVLGHWAAELSRLQTRLGVKFVSVPSYKLPLSGEVAIRLSKNHSVRTHYF